MDSNLIPYQPVISDIKNLIAAGQNVAYNAANRAMIMTYWNIGKRIVEEEQSGAERAEYGKRLISILSDELTKEFGSNYSGRSLRYYRKFYLCFPDFEIWNTRVPNLNWSHFRALLRVPDEDARVWYICNNHTGFLAFRMFSAVCCGVWLELSNQKPIRGVVCILLNTNSMYTERYKEWEGFRRSWHCRKIQKFRFSHNAYLLVFGSE